MDRVISEINDTLEPLEKKAVSHYKSLIHPVLFVVSPPRSGTTFLYQLLTLQYDLFYPSNLLAKFFKAPYIISKSLFDLNILNTRNTSNLLSDLGNTTGILEPHEWGWFWDYHLISRGTVPINELAALQSLFDKPMLFKNIFFNYNINLLEAHVVDCVFIFLSRDPVDTASSIKRAITSIHSPIGNKHYRNYFNKFLYSPDKLAAITYLYDQKLIEHSLSGKNVINVDYASVCDETTNFFKYFEKQYSHFTNRKLQKRQDPSSKETIAPIKKRSFTDAQVEKELNRFSHLTLDELSKMIFGDKPSVSTQVYQSNPYNFYSDVKP